MIQSHELNLATDHKSLLLMFFLQHKIARRSKRIEYTCGVSNIVADMLSRQTEVVTQPLQLSEIAKEQAIDELSRKGYRDHVLKDSPKYDHKLWNSPFNFKDINTIEKILVPAELQNTKRVMFETIKLDYLLAILY